MYDTENIKILTSEKLQPANISFFLKKLQKLLFYYQNSCQLILQCVSQNMKNTT